MKLLNTQVCAHTITMPILLITIPGSQELSTRTMSEEKLLVPGPGPNSFSSDIVLVLSFHHNSMVSS